MSARIVVYHAGYGCDTGCCGHVIELTDGVVSKERFWFGHPYGGDHLAFAKECVLREFGAEHVADLDWENCKVLDHP